MGIPHGEKHISIPLLSLQGQKEKGTQQIKLGLQLISAQLVPLLLFILSPFPFAKKSTYSFKSKRSGSSILLRRELSVFSLSTFDTVLTVFCLYI